MRLQKCYGGILQGRDIGLTGWGMQALLGGDGMEETKCVVASRDGHTGATTHMWQWWQVEVGYIVTPEEGVQ